MSIIEPTADYHVTAEELRQFIERIESLDAEKKDITEQQKEVMAEAKGRGYDTKVIRKLVALRKRDKNDIAEEEAILADISRTYSQVGGGGISAIKQNSTTSFTVSIAQEERVDLLTYEATIDGKGKVSVRKTGENTQSP